MRRNNLRTCRSYEIFIVTADDVQVMMKHVCMRCASGCYFIHLPSYDDDHVHLSVVELK